MYIGNFKVTKSTIGLQLKSLDIRMKYIVLITALLNCLGCYSQPQQDLQIVILNGIILDGTGKQVLRGYDILIEKGKIKKIGKNITFPRKAKKIDASGKTIIPGLIDMHGHMYALGMTQEEAYPLLYLAGGVTTIFSPGEFEPEKTFRMKEEIKSGHRVGPDILYTGPYFDTAPSQVSWMPVAADTAAMSELFGKWKNRIDGIKVYSSISKEHFDFMVGKAVEHKLIITGHLGTLGTRYAIEHGINGLEHGLASINDFGGDPNDYVAHACHVADLDLTSDAVGSLIDLMVSKKVYLDPTLAVIETMSPDFKPIVNNLSYYLDEKALTIHNNYDKMTSTLFPRDCAVRQLEKQLEFCRMVFQKGGILVAGTDPVSAHILPGFGMKREIHLFLRSGIPLVDVIKIASLNAANVLGISNRTGSIETGKDADLSIIEGDVTADYALLYKTELVLKRGKLYESKVLLESAKGKVRSGY